LLTLVTLVLTLAFLDVMAKLKHILSGTKNDTSAISKCLPNSWDSRFSLCLSAGQFFWNSLLNIFLDKLITSTILCF